jgi:hypothetical protein
MKNKNKLIGILYSNDTIDVVELDSYWNENLKESDKERGCYLWEDVVLCVGNDKEKIETKLKKFLEEDEF